MKGLPLEVEEPGVRMTRKGWWLFGLGFVMSLMGLLAFGLILYTTDPKEASHALKAVIGTAVIFLFGGGLMLYAGKKYGS